MFRTAAIVTLTLIVSQASVFAADATGKDEASSKGAASSTAIATSVAAAATTTVLGGDIDWSLPPVRFGAPTTRPAVLPVLYAGLAALNAYDGYSTRRAIAMGAHEANGAMHGVASNSAAMWGMKAASTALPILLAERMWHNNRVAAIVMMVAANGVMAAVAANNTRVIQQLQ